MKMPNNKINIDCLELRPINQASTLGSKLLKRWASKLMKTISFILLLVFSNMCFSDDMEIYMEDTDDLINMGEYEEALERTIWFHNHSIEHQKSISAVRLSFAIHDWYDFGTKYPPAMDALIKVRDEKTKTILSGFGTYDLFDDVSAINGVLSEDAKTISLFKKISTKQPSLAKECWYIVRDIAIKDKQHALLAQYNTNALTEYAEAEKLLKEMLIRFKGEDVFIKMNKDIFIEKTLELIELSISLNDNKTALEIKNKATSLISDKRLSNVSI